MERTSVETTGNGCDDDLESEEGGHAGQDGAVLVVDGMDSDDMDGWRILLRKNENEKNGKKNIPELAARRTAVQMGSKR